MKKTFLAAAAVLGLGLFSAAHAAPIPAGAAAPAASASQTTQAAIIVRRRFVRRPACTVTVTRYRTPRGWVSRRVRRCR